MNQIKNFLKMLWYLILIKLTLIVIYTVVTDIPLTEGIKMAINWIKTKFCGGSF